MGEVWIVAAVVAAAGVYLAWRLLREATRPAGSEEGCEHCGVHGGAHAGGGAPPSRGGPVNPPLPRRGV